MKEVIYKYLVYRPQFKPHLCILIRVKDSSSTCFDEGDETHLMNKLFIYI